MARTLLQRTISTPIALSGHTYPSLDGAPTLAIYTDAAHTMLATVYAAATGGGTSANPITPDANGVAIGWLDGPTTYYWVSGVASGTYESLPSLIGRRVFNAQDPPYGAKGDGATDDTAAINAAVTACAAVGGGTVLVPYTVAGYVVRRADPASQFGGIRIQAPNVTLLGFGTKLLLGDNCSFVGISSPLNVTNGANGLPYAVVTADVAVGATTLTIDDLGQFSVGDWLHIELGQASYDAGEPDYWEFAQVLAKSASTGAGTLTLDRELARPMVVASTSNAHHRSVQRIITLVEHVTVKGFEFVNDMNEAAGHNAEYGAWATICRDIRYEEITGTNTGVTVVGGQYIDGLEARNISCKGTALQGTGSKGNVVSLAECRNVVYDGLYGENFEGAMVVIEAGCQNVTFRNLRINNNFHQPAAAITTPATGQATYTYSGALPPYLRSGSYVLLAGGANPTEALLIDAVVGSTVTLHTNIANAGHTTAQIMRRPDLSLLVALGDHASVRVNDAVVTGTPALIYNGYTASASAVRFEDLTIDSRSADPTYNAFGGVPLALIDGRLTVNRVNYSKRRTYTRLVQPPINGNPTVYPFPLGLIAHMRVYTTTLTGITDVRLITSGFYYATASLLSRLVANQWADMTDAVTLLTGGIAGGDTPNSTTTQGLGVFTDATYPGGTNYLLVETDLFIASNSGWADYATDITLKSGLVADYTDGLPIGPNGLLLPGLVQPASLAIGQGTTILKHLSATAAWTPGAIASAASASTTLTVTGAALGDTVAVGYNQALAAGLVISGQVSAANTVRVTIANLSGGSVTPAAGTIRADIWQH